MEAGRRRQGGAEQSADGKCGLRSKGETPPPTDYSTLVQIARLEGRGVRLPTRPNPAVTRPLPESPWDKGGRRKSKTLKPEGDCKKRSERKK